MADAYYLPEGEVHKRKPWELLKDMWWRICTRAGNILRAPITRYGANGLPDGETTAEAEFGWNRENIASLKWQQEQDNETTQDKLDRIIKKLEA
jgi:hypothetical protein